MRYSTTKSLRKYTRFVTVLNVSFKNSLWGSWRFIERYGAHLSYKILSRLRLASYIMRYLCGNLDRKLDNASDTSLLTPRRLVDEFLYTLFFYCISVGFASFENMLDKTHGALLVAGSDILTYKSLTSPFRIGCG